MQEAWIKRFKESAPMETVTTPVWVWGANRYPSGGDLPSEPAPAINASPTAQDKVLKLINENPGISGPTLLNLLKVHGLEIVDGLLQMKQADAASANTPALRVEAKERAVSLNRGNIEFRCRVSSFQESSARDDGIGYTRFKVVMLKEGLGNLKDAYYYTKEAIESAVPVFEGKKIYADHPSADEEQSRPERSVKDVLGHFENVKVIAGEDGQHMLEGELVILPDKPYEWARGLMRHSVEYSKKYPDKDFVGLSINASGDAESKSLASLVEAKIIPEAALPKIKQALDEGVETVKVVSAIKDAVSCDMVTEAGAGGKILSMIEREKQAMKVKAKESEEKKETEAKPADKKEGEAPAPEKKDGEGEEKPEPAKEEEKKEDDKPAPEHDDEDADKKLIQDMLDKHLGGKEHPAEVHAMAKEAYENAKEMGLEGDEALTCAGHALKMARHAAQKELKKESKGKEADESEEAKESEGKEKEAAEPKESKKPLSKGGETVTQAGRIAFLEAEVSRMKLEKHVEDTLGKSGLPRHVTKEFREAAGELKTQKDFDTKFAMFKEGYQKASRGEADEFSDLILGMEKQNSVEPAKSMNFSDCAE